MTKVQGTCKWFSNQKGFGFITREDTKEDIFVHQTSIVAPEGKYRTLGEGVAVEFETEQEGDRQKAVNVTAPGGGPIEPPVRKRKPRVPNGKGKDKPEAGAAAAPAAEGDAAAAASGDKPKSDKPKKPRARKPKAAKPKAEEAAA